VIIPIIWTEYTATVNGRLLKLVPCEDCGTEYVYVLERESTGSAICPYSVLGEDDQGRLVSSAEESVRQYLANDFDPVPCPVCGHYQRYMFPKLYEPRFLSSVVAPAAAFVVGGLAVVSAMFWGLTYLQRPDDRALWRLVATCAGLAVAGLGGFGLRALERARVRRFDPNVEDQMVRIARGRCRAVTRAEFEASQQR
jgi:hypothetical protein